MKINPETLKLLKSDVAQLEHDIGDMDINIRNLEARRDAYQFKLELFKEQIAKYGSSGSEATNANGQIQASTPTTLNTTASLHDAGMRDAIRNVLAASNRGLRTSEIAEQMLTRDFQYTASTNLNARLSNELSRMAKIGHIRKTHRKGKLLFSINDGG